MYNTETNIYIIYILNRYIKNRDTDPDDYITANKKPIKINLYKTSIITINTPNNLDTITFTDTIYYSTFLINIISAKYFQFKKIYLNKKHS